MEALQIYLSLHSLQENATKGLCSFLIVEKLLMTNLLLFLETKSYCHIVVFLNWYQNIKVSLVHTAMTK